MNNYLKILLAAILVTILFTREKVCKHLGFGQAMVHESPVVTKNEAKPTPKSEAEPTPKREVEPTPKREEEPRPRTSSTIDTLYRWNEQVFDWVPIKENTDYRPQFVTYNEAKNPAKEPIVLKWEVLIDINYKPRYFEELEMEIYAPVFPKNIQALDGKEVIIDGFVVPFEEELEVLALSANPYASCFFCGKASPASVMSLYLKNKRKRYKLDDYKKFRGTLELNHDDPKDFYYILRDAREE